MTHLEIYKKLELIEAKAGSYIVSNNVGIKDEMIALQYSLVSLVLMKVDTSMTILESQKEFCIACFYINLKTIQQSLNRYLKIDNPKIQKVDFDFECDYDYISEINRDLKELVVKLSHLAIKDCEQVVNTAYDDLKHIDRHQDDDDNDGEDWKKLK